MLTGGSADLWLNDREPQLTSIVCAVDAALQTGCERWQLPRPAVTLAPWAVAGALTAQPVGHRPVQSPRKRWR